MDSNNKGLLIGHDYSHLLHYRLDPFDRIIETDSKWDTFAKQNNGLACLSDRVAGKPIWNFISCSETRSIYESLFRRVRDNHNQLLIPFRCDSPALKRFMKLVIHPAIGGSLDIYSLTIHELSHPYYPLLDACAPRSDEFIIICSWCKKLMIRDSYWVELEEGIRILDLFDSDLPMPRISHHICPDCLKTLSHNGNHH